MLVTREGAEQKWCPMARFAENGGTENTRAVCQAAKCMMWRWFDPPGFTDDEELERRGYCGLAGALDTNADLLNTQPEVIPADFPFSESEFASRTNYFLARQLAKAGIRPGLLKGDVAIESEPIGVMAEAAHMGQSERGGEEVFVSFHVRVLDPTTGVLVPVTGSHCAGFGLTEDSAISNAIELWIETSLPALRRCLDETGRSRPDGYFSTSQNPDEEKRTYAIYNGALGGSRKLQQNLPTYFKDNPFTWLLGHVRLDIPPDNLHLFTCRVRLDAHQAPEVICALNGKRLESAEPPLREFSWPLNYLDHGLSWITFLKRVD